MFRIIIDAGLKQDNGTFPFALSSPIEIEATENLTLQAQKKNKIPC